MAIFSPSRRHYEPEAAISASGSDFISPQNTQCIPEAKIFAFLDHAKIFSFSDSLLVQATHMKREKNDV